MAKLVKGPANILLPQDQVDEWNRRPFYRPGQAYLWILTHGWCCVGYYLGHLDPITIRVGHSNYYRSAGGQTHAQLARSGGNDQTAWEYTGDEVITVPHVIRCTPYSGEVPHGRVARR